MIKCRLFTVGLVLLLVMGTALFAGGQQEQAQQELRMAAIFPGSIQDADYNTLGYIALQESGNHFGMRTAYSERVAVPDAERVLREYATAGFGIIWAHGNQFNGAANNVAPDFPNVTFVLEVDDRPGQLLANVWYLERNYYPGFYVLGALAHYVTKSNIIGYIGGLELPFLRSEINAVNQALRDMNSPARLEYVFVGDFNDPVRARQAGESMIAQGADVLISAVNGGNFGLYTAVKEAGRPVWITTTYTDKFAQAPENFLTSDIFDFRTPIQSVIEEVKKGVRGGYLLMEYGEGKPRYTQFPIRNVPQDVNDRIAEIYRKVQSGEITVVKNLTAILPR